MSLARRRSDEHPRETISRVLADAGAPGDIARQYAELICEQFSGEDVYFAVREWRTLDERNDEMRAMYRAGKSLQAVAEFFCVSRTTAHRVCSPG